VKNGAVQEESRTSESVSKEETVQEDFMEPWPVGGGGGGVRPSQGRRGEERRGKKNLSISLRMD